MRDERKDGAAAGGPSVMADPVVRRLALTSAFSSLGSAFQAIAFTFLAYSQSRNAIVPVLVASSYALAYGVVALPAGRWSARFDRRRVVLAANVAKVGLYVAVLALELADSLTVPAILASSALAGATSAAQYPSWQELVRAVFPPGRLDEANALFSSLSSLANIVGALVGGIALGVVGAAPLFVFNIVSYVPLLWAVSRVPAAAGTQHATGPPPPLAQVARLVGHNQTLRWIFLFMALLEALAFPIVSLLPKLADEIGTSPHWYGLLAAAYYTGAASVAWLLRRLRDRIGYRRTVRAAFFGAGLSIALLGVAAVTDPAKGPLVAIFILSMIAAGVALTVASSVLGALAQLGAPPSIEGAVLGLYALITLGASTIGGLTQGQLADALVIDWVVLAVGGLLIGTGGGLRVIGAFYALEDLQRQCDPDCAHLVRHAHAHGSRLVGHGPPAQSPITCGTDECCRDHEGDRLERLERDADRFISRHLRRRPRLLEADPQPAGTID